MSIITYPLNGVTYDAEDVSTYLCTRTSGVYAKDTNYAVSVTGPRQITVAPGLAWINYDDFKGVSACSREAVNLTVPDADGTLPRIDRVVLQFDTAANLTAVKLKPGTPAAAPEPPAILQNHNQYELGLCTVSVPAGSSVVTAADITDTRADEDVCGVMRDGVKGIPTAQLQAQALAIMTQLSTELHTKLDALDAAIAAVESGNFYTKSEADQKFGTPYTLPPAAADQLGGVKVGDKMDPNRDVLHVDDERIYIQKNQQLYYLALYKPRGYVTTASDELGRKTVMDLVSDIPARLYPVGRLDKDSEGLLLMTNDGAFAQAVTHPSGGISKLYRVTVQPRADEATILKLSSGVVLDDGTKTMPCAINVVTDEPGRTVMEMTLKEGKNREIRRMCESVGLEVVRLKRNAEGVVKLGMLKPGTYRELTKAEVNGLRAAAVKGRAQTRSAAQQTKAAERRPRGPVGKNAPRKQK